MRYHRVGRSGLKVSAISIGGWLTYGGSVAQEDSLPIFRRAVEEGINFIDLADIYARGASERAAGLFLRDYVQGGAQRSDLVISSKVFWPMSDNPNDRGLSRKHIIESCEKSLQRLGTDYLDLYFCHRWDDETPLDETARAMDDLVRQGKVLYWGTSVWSAEQLRAVHRLCADRGWDAPIVEQPCYNLLQRAIERDVLPEARELGMGIVAWSPLAGGMLTGKYNAGIPDGSRGANTRWLTALLTEENVVRTRQLAELARELAVTPASLSLAWLLHQPGVTSAITGATRIAQLEENLAGAHLELSAEVLAQLDGIFPFTG